MRLIDADALTDSFREYMNENYNKEKCISAEDCENCNGCLWKKVVDKAPTIEAEPVKHGEWVADPPLEPWHCSVCGFRAGDSMFGLSKYCPNCGAEMDGGKNDD